jgi:hypothetical protein
MIILARCLPSSGGRSQRTGALLECDAHQLRALQRGQRVVEPVRRPRAGDLVARLEEGAVEDGETVVRPVACQDLVGGHTVAGGRGLAQARAHRIRVQAQRLVRDRRQRRHDPRRRRERALVGVQLDEVADLLAGRVAWHRPYRRTQQIDGGRALGIVVGGHRDSRLNPNTRGQSDRWPGSSSSMTTRRCAKGWAPPCVGWGTRR